jgi:Flp pilus assembly CpaF family ATPase
MSILRFDDAIPFFDARLADGNRVHAVLGTLASPGTCISLAMVWGPEGVLASSAGLQ